MSRGRRVGSLAAGGAAQAADVIIAGRSGTSVRVALAAFMLGDTATSTVFNADGSIAETIGGVNVTTVFNANGTITRTFGAPISGSITTTFNSDGSITEA